MTRKQRQADALKKAIAAKLRTAPTAGPDSFRPLGGRRADGAQRPAPPDVLAKAAPGSNT